VALCRTAYLCVAVKCPPSAKLPTRVAPKVYNTLSDAMLTVISEVQFIGWFFCAVFGLSVPRKHIIRCRLCVWRHAQARLHMGSHTPSRPELSINGLQYIDGKLQFCRQRRPGGPAQAFCREPDWNVGLALHCN
jgi:hypothetical protein